MRIFYSTHKKCKNHILVFLQKSFNIGDIRFKKGLLNISLIGKVTKKFIGLDVVQAKT